MEPLTSLDPEFRGVGREHVDVGWERRLGRPCYFLFYTPNVLATFDPKNSMEWGMAFWGALNSKGLCR